MGKEIPAIPDPPQTFCPLAPTAFWMCWGQLLSASTEQKQVPFLSWYILLIVLVIKCCSFALGTTTARPGDETAQLVYVWIYVNVPPFRGVLWEKAKKQLWSYHEFTYLSKRKTTNKILLIRLQGSRGLRAALWSGVKNWFRLPWWSFRFSVINLKAMPAKMLNSAISFFKWPLFLWTRQFLRLIPVFP